jgi:hypothetical protein
LSRHPSSLKEEIWTKWFLFNFIPTERVLVLLLRFFETTRACLRKF